jgi:hypothetical protein
MKGTGSVKRERCSRGKGEIEERRNKGENKRGGRKG